MERKLNIEKNATVKDIRDRADLSLESMAKVLGIPPQRLLMYELIKNDLDDDIKTLILNRTEFHVFDFQFIKELVSDIKDGALSGFDDSIRVVYDQKHRMVDWYYMDNLVPLVDGQTVEVKSVDEVLEDLFSLKGWQ